MTDAFYAFGMDRRAKVVHPPLLLSRHFIDYPYLTMLQAVQAAAVLREQGWEVEIIDGMARPDAELTRDGDTAWLGEPRSVFLERLSKLDSELVLLVGSPFLQVHPGQTWLTDLVRCLAPRVQGTLALGEMVVGGMHYVEIDGARLRERLPGLDLVLRYEGEVLLERLCRALEAGERPTGVWENREPFPLREIPAPAWDLVEVETYFGFLGRVLGSAWRRGPMPPEPARTLPLITARGCSYGCIFCSRNPGLPGDRRQVRTIPPERVASWVRHWQQEYGLERLVVLDEVVNLQPERFDRLLDLMEELDLRVELPNGLRADRLTRAHVQRLGQRTSGLKVSLETASPRLQTLVGKRLDPASVEQVAAWCAELGVDLEIHCLMGLPGETREECVATLELAAQLYEQHGARPRLQFATPLPGTELAERCAEAGLTPDTSSDLHAAFTETPMIHTDTQDADFLQRARRALETRVHPGERKVIVNLTYRCNNHCVFCAVGDRPAQDAEAREVIQALGRYRQEGFGLVDIDGGEPTLHDGLLEVIAAARQLGFEHVALITNGRRLSYPQYAEAILGSEVDEVLVSLHAPEPGLQTELTGEPQSFAQTVAGLRNLLARMDPRRVAVNTTVVQKNLRALPALAILLGELSIRRWNLQVVTPFGRASASQVPDPEALREGLKALLESPTAGLEIQVINCPPCLLPGLEAHAAVDFGKADRDMVFVGARGENLQTFLAQRRRQDERCAGCPEGLICPGFYVFSQETP